MQLPSCLQEAEQETFSVDAYLIAYLWKLPAKGHVHIAPLPPQSREQKKEIKVHQLLQKLHKKTLYNCIVIWKKKFQEFFEKNVN